MRRQLTVLRSTRKRFSPDGTPLDPHPRPLLGTLRPAAQSAAVNGLGDIVGQQRVRAVLGVQEVRPHALPSRAARSDSLRVDDRNLMPRVPKMILSMDGCRHCVSGIRAPSQTLAGCKHDRPCFRISARVCVFAKRRALRYLADQAQVQGQRQAPPLRLAALHRRRQLAVIACRGPHRHFLVSLCSPKSIFWDSTCRYKATSTPPSIVESSRLSVDSFRTVLD